MFGRLVLAIVIVLAFVQGPINAAAAARCCAEPDSHHPSLVDGCCAPMACCVTSEKVEPQPVTPSPTSVQFTALAPVALPASAFSSRAGRHEISSAPLHSVAHSPPPLALLCSRLI